MAYVEKGGKVHAENTLITLIFGWQDEIVPGQEGSGARKEFLKVSRKLLSHISICRKRYFIFFP